MMWSNRWVMYSAKPTKNDSGEGVVLIRYGFPSNMAAMRDVGSPPEFCAKPHTPPRDTHLMRTKRPTIRLGTVQFTGGNQRGYGG